MKIRDNIKEMKREVKETKSEIKQNHEELTVVRAEINNMKEQWESERNELQNKTDKLKETVERVDEREKIPNNMVITGIEMDRSNKVLKKGMADMMKKENSVNRAYNRCILDIDEWSDKLKILKDQRKYLHF